MSDTRPWSVTDSADLYRIDDWGAGFFRVGASGRVEVTPAGAEGPSLDLAELVTQLQGRGLGLPLLLRFPDIIRSRVRAITGAFDAAIAEEKYGGTYHCVYPIKVNQQRAVVEAVLGAGNGRPIGLEAGSKPELLAALAMADTPGAHLVLNGYKDAEFIETALLARKLGRDAILVIDRFRELDMIIKIAKRLDIRPRIGVRARLDTQADGKWAESSGMGAKFGLDPSELITTVKILKEHDLLDALNLLHFHVGSQITDIRGLKEAVQEGARVYVELSRLGAGLGTLDVGGGLGVDYDGSQTTSHSSMNYGLQEYANNVVFHIREMCDEAGVPHPDILSESGRATVAHHSVLVADVPDVDSGLSQSVPDPIQDDEHRVFHALYDTWKAVDEETAVECWHDANHAREEAAALFAHGVFGLPERARADNLFRACCSRILDVVQSLDEEERAPEFDDLERRFCDIFFGNFSVFQSAPDHWAVDQVFPVMPIHRLQEEPTRFGVLADLTCDSDGVIDRFIGPQGDRAVLPMHAPDGQPYLVGIFLLGAYQEILGDLHNLFGDTNAVHVSLDEDGRPTLADVVEHDSVTDVLRYVGFERSALLGRVRIAVEAALRSGTMTLAESALFLKDYERSLAGPTYLEENAPATGTYGMEALSDPAPAVVPGGAKR